jgi:hypothetical protein
MATIEAHLIAQQTATYSNLYFHHAPKPRLYRVTIANIVVQYYLFV